MWNLVCSMKFYISLIKTIFLQLAKFRLFTYKNKNNTQKQVGNPGVQVYNIIHNESKVPLCFLTLCHPLPFYKR